MPRQFLVIDDHPIVQQAMSDALGTLEPDCEVRSAGRLTEALRMLRNHGPVDLILFDLRLPDSHGVEGLMSLRQQHPDCPVVVFSADVDAPMILRCLELGAYGYIPKTLANDAIQNALRMVASGCAYVPPQILATDQAIRPRPDPMAGPRADVQTLGLTERQLQVLRLMLRGMPNKLICRQLSLAEGTVKVHVSAVLRALGVRTRTQAVITASRMGLRLLD